MKIPSSFSTFLLAAALIVIFVLPTTNAEKKNIGTPYTQNFNNAIEGAVELTCDHSPPEKGPHIFEKKDYGLRWTFKIPDNDPKTPIYKCTVTWNDKKAEIVVYDASFKDEQKCKSPNSIVNICSWVASPDGIYFSREGAPFPGPSWKLNTPWSPK